VTLLALDTSVAVGLAMASHTSHAGLVRWQAGREVRLSGHAVAETYSVLTRLLGDASLLPADAARLIEASFAPPLGLSRATAAAVPSLLAELDIKGGAVYDALVALAALEHDAVLATRDARARPTYEAVGARVEVVAA